jgi:hypothetical protein
MSQEVIRNNTYIIKALTNMGKAKRAVRRSGDMQIIKVIPSLVISLEKVLSSLFLIQTTAGTNPFVYTLHIICNFNIPKLYNAMGK